MKKILIIMITFLMMSTVAAVDTSDWGQITLCGENFKIPPKYENGEFLSQSYEKGNFQIICMDKMLVGNYGFLLKKATVTKDLTIDGHPAKYLRYNKENSRIYFAVGDSIYAICWKGTSIPSEIKEIISSSTPSEMSESSFYAKLDAASNTYQNNQKSYNYNMEPDDDCEDYNEYAAYDDIGEAKFCHQATSFNLNLNLIF